MNVMNIVLIVVSLLTVVGFIIVITGDFTAGLNLGPATIYLRSASLSSSQTLENCKDFYGAYFSEDFPYAEKFGGLFSESSGDLLYTKLKLFCGAFMPIADAEEGGGDVEGTVAEINRVYSHSYTGLEFDYQEISSAIEGQPKEVWLQEVQNILEAGINRKVS